MTSSSSSSSAAAAAAAAAAVVMVFTDAQTSRVCNSSSAPLFYL